MLNKLNEYQLKMLEKYKEKYIKLGLNTDRINKVECEKVIKEFYIKILGKKCEKVIICESPYQLWRKLCLYKVWNEVNDKVWNVVWNEVKINDKVWNKVWNNFENKVSNKVNNEVVNKVRKKVEEVINEVKNEVNNEVVNKVNNEVVNKVNNEVRKKVEEVINEVNNEVNNEVWDEVVNKVENVENEVNNKYLIDFVTPYLLGAFDSYYFSFLSYFSEVCNIQFKDIENYKLYKKLCDYSYIYPLDDVCFLSEKPVEICLNEKNELHNENAPALKYSDGFSLYMMNGVRMPKEIILTPKDKLDCKLLYEIDNVEVADEFIKKVGIYRVLKELNCKIIDKINADDLYKQKPIGSWSQQGDIILEPEFESIIEYKNLGRSFKNRLKHIDYELINLKIKKGEYRPYLKMTNASLLLNEIHIQGVYSTCQTVFEALCFRNTKDTLPCQLT